MKEEPTMKTFEPYIHQIPRPFAKYDPESDLEAAKQIYLNLPVSSNRYSLPSSGPVQWMERAAKTLGWTEIESRNGRVFGPATFCACCLVHSLLWLRFLNREPDLDSFIKSEGLRVEA